MNAYRNDLEAAHLYAEQLKAELQETKDELEKERASSQIKESHKKNDKKRKEELQDLQEGWEKDKKLINSMKKKEKKRWEKTKNTIDNMKVLEQELQEAKREKEQWKKIAQKTHASHHEEVNSSTLKLPEISGSKKSKRFSISVYLLIIIAIVLQALSIPISSHAFYQLSSIVFLIILFFLLSEKRSSK